MGIFKSSKTADVPLPNLSLHLSHPEEQIFQPDSTISGHISLTSHIPITPQAVEVLFWGNSSTWIRTRHSNSGTSGNTYHHYRDRAPLFTVTLNMMPNPHQLVVGQTYTYPFTFRVPQGTGFNRSRCYKDATDTRFTTLPHSLPPTFTHGDPNNPDNALITYGITARLLCPGIGTGKHNTDPLSTTAPIYFQPTNPHAHLSGPLSVLHHPKTLSLQSSLLSAQPPPSLGFTTRLHDRFSSSTPKLTFSIALELPDLLTSGAEFRFRASFSTLSKSENVAHIPPILFRVQKLELLDFTFFRAPRDWDCMSNMSGSAWKKDTVVDPCMPYTGQEQVVFREKKTLLNSVPPQQTIALAEIPVPGDGKGDEKMDGKVEGEVKQAEGCECWFSARVPGFTVPSFTSFAISRSYRIRVRLGVEIGERSFRVEVESGVRALGGAA